MIHIINTPSKISDFGDLPLDFHILIGIVCDPKAAAAERDPACFGLKNDAVWRIFQNSPVVFHHYLIISHGGDNAGSHGHIPRELQGVHYQFLRVFWKLFSAHIPFYEEGADSNTPFISPFKDTGPRPDRVSTAKIGSSAMKG